MYSTSEKFQRAIRRSHVVSTRIEVLSSEPGNEWNILHNNLIVTQGNVSVNGNNANRRSGTLTVVDPTGELTPSEAEDLLHPVASNWVRLWRGIKFPDGTTEHVSLGVFDIYDADITDSGENLSTQLRLWDFSKRVQRARLESNYVVDAGGRYDDAIRNIVQFAYPSVIFSNAFAAVDAITPDLVFGSSGNQTGGDPWKYAQEMAASVGHVLYFDIQGYCRLEPVPDLSGDPVWEYHEGEEATMLHLQKRIRTENTFNKVIATGENSAADNPVRGEAVDDDPNSPTYYYGAYGQVPTFFRSAYIRTQEQAQLAAEARLRQVKGATESVQITAVPNPAHEVGDIVHIKRGSSKVDSKFVIDSFNINLSAQQSMNVSMRDIGSVSYDPVV